MANADQILSLIRNHLNNDDAQFRKVALQISAVEAKNGHAVLARTIQELLSQKKTSFSNLKIIPRNKDVDDLLLQTETYDSLNDLVTDKSVKEKLERVIKEYSASVHSRHIKITNKASSVIYTVGFY
mgnify:CR=1 FL=1